MIKYPLNFTVQAKTASGKNTPLEATAEGLPPIIGAVPEQFGGPGGGYSPEDLFALSVVSCFIATFEVFAEKAKLTFAEIQGEGKLIIDRNEKGIPEFKTLDMTFTLSGVEDQEKARAVLAESEKFCLVSNAISCPENFNYAFS